MPEKPKWGDVLQVTYDTSSSPAIFLPGDEVYVSCYAARSDSPKRSWARMEKDGNLFRYQLRVEKGTFYLSFSFFNLDQYDRKIDLRTMVFREDGWPARGAWHQEMLNSPEDRYMEAFQKERELYPDNYAVFRDKWFMEGYSKKKELKAIVARDMEVLKKAPGESAERLFALVRGYLELDDEKASLEALRQLAGQYPRSYYMECAFSDYDYIEFSRQLKGEGPEEVRRMKLDLLKRTPDSERVREMCRVLVKDKDLRLESVRAVCGFWMKDEPENPMPYYTLALALLNKEGDLRKAAGMMDKAKSLLVSGKLRFYGDISGTLTQLELPVYFKISADIRHKLGDYAAALADIKAAQTLGREVRPDFVAAEAAIWREMGFFRKAEDMLFEALRLGVLDAESSFREIYQKRHGSAEGFETYLAEKMKKLAASAPSGKKPAPDFEVQTLDGKALRLAELKGKVVVLNFWFIGCAPCRVEMPGLNKLTEEFGSDEVVFIAFALDKAELLREFLKEVPFRYQIVPEAGAIASLFGATAFPTHIMINKNGEIEFFSLGGSLDKYEELRPLIRALLR
jgi:thiol-disulfide isomerase/thioredoxin